MQSLILRRSLLWLWAIGAYASEEMGALLYRGPLDRRDGEFMCQMKDPFGNLFGLVGPNLNQD
jgi:hypothetical protein